MTDTSSKSTATDCPGCGMSRDTWPDDSTGGGIRDEATFCCAGCANGACTCQFTGNRTQETHTPLNEHLQDNPGAPKDPAQDGVPALGRRVQPTEQ